MACALPLLPLLEVQGAFFVKAFGRASQSSLTRNSTEGAPRVKLLVRRSDVGQPAAQPLPGVVALHRGKVRVPQHQRPHAGRQQPACHPDADRRLQFVPRQHPHLQMLMTQVFCCE